MTTSTGDVYAELERLRRIIDAIERYCVDVTMAYPPNRDQDAVAYDVMNIIREAR